MASRATSRALVLWGRCWEAGGAPVYWPWVQALRSLARSAEAESLTSWLGVGALYLARLVPELRERIPDVVVPPGALFAESDVERLELFDAVATFLRRAAASRPMLLLLEDLHAADRSSLLLLAFLAAEVRDSRLLVVGTYRELEAEDRPLGELLGRLGALRERLVLRGLDRREVAELVERTRHARPSPALAAAVEEATRGNPFFLRLVLSERSFDPASAAPVPIPEGLRQAIRNRLESISSDGREVLAAASVFGRECEVGPLAEVCDLSAEATLASLEQARVSGIVAEISSARGRYAFAHDLVRDTVYGDLPYARRLELHAKAGEALERRYAANLEPHLAELALHFRRASSSTYAGRAVDYAIRAGRRASSDLAWDEAAVQFERALSLLDASVPDDVRRIEVRISLGEALNRAGDADAARRIFLETADLAKHAGKPALLARAALGLGGAGFGGTWAVVRADDEVLVPLLEAALQRLPHEDAVLRAKVLARLATALHHSPPYGRREDLSREAVELARAAGDLAALAHTLAARHYALCAPAHVEQRLAIADEIISLAERSADRELGLQGRAWRIVDLVEIGGLTRAANEVAGYARLAEALRQPFYFWYAASWRAMLAIASGDFAEAERLANAALEVGRRAQGVNAEHTFSVQRIEIRMLEGRIDEAIPDAERDAAQYPDLVGWRYTLARLYAEVGRMDEARRELDRAGTAADAVASCGPARLSLAAGLTEAVALVRDTVRAETLYERMRSSADRVIVDGHDAVHCQGAASHYLGLLAATLDRRQAAIAHFREAVDRHARMGARPLEACSALELARALAVSERAEDQDEARANARRSLAIAEALGMVRVAAEVRALAILTPSGVVARDREAGALSDGTVTLMFSDMAGFTEMTERLGDAAALEVSRVHNKIVRNELARHAGSELELQGDGFLLAFPKARNALECAIAIQRDFAAYSAEHPEGPIRVRMGIHTGEPIRESDRYFGKSVILAARIAAQARGGEILVSSVVKDLCEGLGDVRFDEPRDVELKGLAGTRRLLRVAWDDPAAAGPARGADQPSERGSVFRLEGEYWTIVYESRAFRLKDSKGLRYLAELLRAPGSDVHVSTLVGAAESTASSAGRAGGGSTRAGLGDAGEILDARAKVEYGRRLEDLRDALGEAERFDDRERAERARAEIELLSEELASAVGLGGRDRRAASTVERARLSVTLAIKAALKRIAVQSPALGRHLRATVKTGKFCCYAPDPRAPIHWDF